MTDQLPRFEERDPRTKENLVSVTPAEFKEKMRKRDIAKRERFLDLLAQCPLEDAPEFHALAIEIATEHVGFCWPTTLYAGHEKLDPERQKEESGHETGEYGVGDSPRKTPSPGVREDNEV